jgi:predicted RNA methylase
LLACIEADSKESRRKVTGSYYTPREIVDYMINEALDAILEQSPQRKQGEHVSFLANAAGSENLLLRCAILDPACGSGAFPCGVMNAIMKRIDPDKTLSQSERYAKKLEILRNVIYGVDIQPMAAQITVLRLFLSMILEITPTKDARNNFGIDPLPNLDYKFVVANTLMELNGNDLFFRENQHKFQQLIDLKRDFFREFSVAEKGRLRARIESLEEELATESGSPPIVALYEWKHSDTSPAPYFDSRWMFSIDKFDIVIGNPPYGARYPAEHKEYFKQKYVSAKTTDIEKDGSIVGKLKGSLDTFSLFIENGFNSLKTGGYLTFIVPLSFVSSDSMTALHDILFNNCKTIRVSSYAKRPAQIFRTSCVANTIMGVTRTNTKCEHLWTTTMNRLVKRKNLDTLLGALKFTDGLQFCMRGRIPKISLPIEKRILKKMFVKRHSRIRDLIDKNGKPIFYRSSGGRYYNVVTNSSQGSTKEKALFLDKKLADTIGATLSSSLFWWYQQVYTNGLDLKSYEIDSFPIPMDKLTPAIRRKIEKLYEQYLQSIERHVIDRESQEYKHITKFKEYKIRYSKALIDAMDDIICPLYGLTEEETEFIKHYELQFRIDG